MIEAPDTSSRDSIRQYVDSVVDAIPAYFEESGKWERIQDGPSDERLANMENYLLSTLLFENGFVVEGEDILDEYSPKDHICCPSYVLIPDDVVLEGDIVITTSFGLTDDPVFRADVFYDGRPLDQETDIDWNDYHCINDANSVRAEAEDSTPTPEIRDRGSDLFSPHPEGASIENSRYRNGLFLGKIEAEGEVPEEEWHKTLSRLETDIYEEAQGLEEELKALH